MEQARTEAWKLAIVGLALAAITCAVYWPVRGNDFVNYDDNAYIADNVHVIHGLNWPDAKWAFATGRTGYPQPITWLTHQLDYQLWGVWAGGHHLTSLAIHVVNTLLLFLLFWRMTGGIWPGAFIAAVFALHPLHVESVVWVAERKDVLSALFFFLTLHAYIRYAEKPRAAPYLFALLFFALGLLSKPMLVTMPFVLLLLDYWPLRRMSLGAPGSTEFRPTKILLEKIPFFLLAAVWSVITFISVRQFVMPETARLGFGPRVANAIVSYAIYLGKTFWPSDLAVFYPLPRMWPWAIVLVSAAVLLVVTGFCVSRRNSSPYLIAGWLWYLGMLVPVIGFVQSGFQGRADRYNYLPQIGLIWIVTLAVVDVSVAWRNRRQILGAAAMVAIAAMIWGARTQISYWHNSESLWRHALAVTTDNELAHDHLGVALTKQGCIDESIAQFERALQLNPDYADAHNNLGIVLGQKGNLDEAIAHYQKALEIQPQHPVARSNLANALVRKEEIK